jgi:hypothetical protein
MMKRIKLHLEARQFGAFTPKSDGIQINYVSDLSNLAIFYWLIA